MIYPLSAQTCVEAWLKAADLLSGMTGRYAYNVILDIEHPLGLGDLERRIVETVDRFLTDHDANPVATVAATIFPSSDDRRNRVKCSADGSAPNS